MTLLTISRQIPLRLPAGFDLGYRRINTNAECGFGLTTGPDFPAFLLLLFIVFFSCPLQTLSGSFAFRFTLFLSQNDD